MQHELLQDLAALHTEQLRRAAAEERRALAGRPHSWRQRTGWTLITIGLRLAVNPTVHPRTG
jgi:hypothetical protein